MRRRLLSQLDLNTYLTFTAINSCTFKFSNQAYYSIDNGATWTFLNSNTSTPTVNSGSKIIWKSNITPSSSNGIGTFSATDMFTASGNPLSLIYTDSFADKTSVGYTYAFYRLFLNNTYLVNALDLLLPAITLLDYCYMDMFRGCTNLSRGPKTLPATASTGACYLRMFYGCTSLIIAPRIALTTLSTSCCLEMFSSCSSLTKAPTLYALELKSNCYYYMFNDCTSLNNIQAMFTTTPSTSYTDHWLNNVASTGTFVKNSTATWNVSGVNGVPTGWTILTV